MTTGLAATLRAAQDHAGLSRTELWVRAMSLGLPSTSAGFDEMLDGDRVLSQIEYDMIAQALNERFAELGADHPVPYWDDADFDPPRGPSFGAEPG